MAAWQDEFWWYVDFYYEHDQLPRCVDIAKWRGVRQCSWPQVLLSRGLVDLNGVGGLKFTESGWRMIENRRRKDIVRALEAR